MSITLDYFFAVQSPWTYLGHQRFVAMAKAAGATVRVRPMDLGAVFPVSGGLPLGQRAPQRQAYRLVELARYSEFLSEPCNPKPAFFPVAGDACARLIVAVDRQDGVAAALKLTGAIGKAVWAEERNIADLAVQAALLAECGLAPERLADSLAPEVDAQYKSCTQQAIDAGVFGAPSYVLNGEIFWGQDRLELLQFRLGQKTAGK